MIGWRPGGEGWFTLNTNGSFHASTKSAVVGGLIRDDQGRFVLVATRLGSCSVVRAEMRGVVDGMALAWDKGIRTLRIQTDSSLAVSLFANACSTNHQHSSLLGIFQKLKRRNWEVTLNHVYHEANNVADVLADSGHELDLGTTVFNFPCNTLSN
ncbi:Putative ribonuclease H protein At1g65750 [Linum perenne]